MLQSMEPLDIVILGTSFVGKTSIIARIIYNKWDAYLEPIESRTYHSAIKLEEGDMEGHPVSILDTYDNPNFRAMIRYWIKNPIGLYVLMYSVCDRQSFDHLKTIYQHIQRQYGDSSDNSLPTMILVGNMIDLKERYQVSYDEGESLAKKWKIPFIEVSAKTGENVDEMFRMLIKTHLIGKSNHGCHCILL